MNAHKNRENAPPLARTRLRPTSEPAVTRVPPVPARAPFPARRSFILCRSILKAEQRNHIVSPSHPSELHFKNKKQSGYLLTFTRKYVSRLLDARVMVSPFTPLTSNVASAWPDSNPPSYCSSFARTQFSPCFFTSVRFLTSRRLPPCHSL